MNKNQRNDVVIVHSTLSASNAIVETTTTTEELVTDFPSGSSPNMGINSSDGVPHKRKNLQPNDLKIVKKRTPRTMTPYDEVGIFGNHLLMELSKMTNENYRDETQLQLMELIQNQPVKLKCLKKHLFLNILKKKIISFVFTSTRMINITNPMVWLPKENSS